MSQHVPTRLTQRLKAGRTGDPLATRPTDRVSGGLEPGAADCACHPSAHALLGSVDPASAPHDAGRSSRERGARNLRILGIIVILNLATMCAELVTGYLARSVSLTADGWHMAGHTVALGLTYFVMRHLLRMRTSLAATPASHASAEATPQTLRLLRIERTTGLLNAGLLILVGAFTVFDAVRAFAHPPAEDFRVALGVACVGLVVNVVGGVLLHDAHDHTNVAERGMYLHILSDALMSLLAIAAIAAGLFAGLTLADPVVGVLGGLVILKWGASLFAQGLRK